MDCKEFKKKSRKDTIDFATKEKIYKNCFSKTHDAPARKSTSNNFYLDQEPMLYNPGSVRTFLQVTPVKVKHGANTTVVNSLLDSSSDATLITSELAKV